MNNYVSYCFLIIILSVSLAELSEAAQDTENDKSTNTNLVRQPNPNVFRVIAGGCGTQPDRNQTGFITKEHGLLTALHGVAGCTKITIRNERKPRTKIKNLKITAFDIKRDVAKLSNLELESMLESLKDREPPYKIVDFSTIKSGDIDDDYSVIGYSGSKKQRKRQLVKYANTLKLKDIVEEETLDDLEACNSPDINQDMMEVEGELTKGFSGAPVLTKKGEVIGMLLGGVLNEKSEVAWGVLMKDISLEVDAKTDLRSKFIEPCNMLKLADAFPSEEIPTAGKVALGVLGILAVAAIFSPDPDPEPTTPAITLVLDPPDK